MTAPAEVATNLPAGWRVRPPTLRDVPAILTVVRARPGEPAWSTEEVVAALTAPRRDPARDAWLALDAAGRPVGWGYLGPPPDGGVVDGLAARDCVEVYVRAGAGELARAPLLDLAVTRAAERAGDLGYAEATLRAGVGAADTAYVAALTAAGFAFVRRHLRMSRPLTGAEAVPRPLTGAEAVPRPLTGAEAVPQPPSGVAIRALRPDEPELRGFHSVLEAAFAGAPNHRPSPYPQWRDRVVAAGPSWDEWVVAVVDGGAIVGGLQSVDRDPAEGYVANLAVLPAFRRRGIGAALLRTAFAAYAANGRTSAALAVDAGNPTGALRLYRSVGMVPTYEADAYERTVTPAIVRG